MWHLALEVRTFDGRLARRFDHLGADAREYPQQADIIGESVVQSAPLYARGPEDCFAVDNHLDANLHQRNTVRWVEREEVVGGDFSRPENGSKSHFSRFQFSCSEQLRQVFCFIGFYF